MSAEDDFMGANEFSKKTKESIKYMEERSKIINNAYYKRIDYEHKMVVSRDLQRKLTSTTGMMGGGVIGNMMNMVAGLGSIKMNNYNRLQSLNKKDTLTPEETKERDSLKGGVGMGFIGKLDRTFEKAFGGNSKWNKAFGGHGKMAAAGMGVGAIGGGMALGKAIIDSSPMFQQMLKLLKFGIMMVLRPIGDFFGFVMRPIMILLLRKFIIPWYSKMYPQMMKWGTEIGTKLAGALEALADGDIAGAFAAIWGEVDWGDTIWKVLKSSITPLAIGDLVFGAMGKGDGEGFNAIGQEIRKRLDEIDWTGVQTSWNNIGTNFATMTENLNTSWNSTMSGFTVTLAAVNGSIVTSMLGGYSKLVNFFYTAGAGASGWVADRWDSITQFFADISGNVTNWINEKWDNFTDFFANHLGNVWSTLGKYWNSFVSFFASIGNTVGYLGNLIGITAANGYDGMVNKPTLMLVGEAGAEHVKVTPNNQLSSGGGGGSVININIENMSASQQDLNALKTTILSVVQEANTRRGRI